MDKYKNEILQLLEQDGFPHDALDLKGLVEGRNIIIYGAGGGFHWVHEILMNIYGYIPRIVLDRRFKRGDMYKGIPAFSPDDYEPDEREKQDSLVIISVGKQQYHGEIKHTLGNMGFQNIIVLMDIYEIHNPFNRPEEVAAKGFNYYKEQKDLILSCVELFEDEMSREIYTSCLRTHLTRKPVPIPGCDPSEQYTPADIKLTKGYSKYIYCGIDTEELDRCFDNIGIVDDIVCFEPNEHQVNNLVTYFKKNRNKVLRNVVIYPCAIYSKEAKMPFIDGGKSAFWNRISDNGNHMVQCVSIDNVIPDFKPTFISMDIEGSELEALRGAENTIRESCPDMAVCVYHSPSHLWQVPLYLHKIVPEYKFYLRNYTTFTTETVVYAVQK
jgi:FkbM family methyltransferase